MVKIATGARPVAPRAQPGLVFNEAKHSYRMNLATNSKDYRRVSGVTGIIGKTLAKPALNDYRVEAVGAYVRENLADTLLLLDEHREGRISARQFDVALSEASTTRRDKAATRGKAIHTLAEKVVAGVPVTVPAEYVEPVDQYARWLDTYQFTPLLLERQCGNRALWYAGTFDLIGEFGRGPHAGERWLIDLKTSKSVYGETCLQTVGYANAEFYVDEDGHDRPMPSVDAHGVLHLEPNRAKLHDLGDMATAWKEFEAIITLHQSINRRNRLIERIKS